MFQIKLSATKLLTTKSKYLSILVVCALQACSSISELSTSSVEIWDAQLNVEEVSSSPFVYRTEVSGKQVYLTTLKECGFDPKFALTATTRQLFIGFDNLKIVHQQKIDLSGQPALLSVAYARQEKRPIRLVCYSTHSGECVTDVVFWTEDAISTEEIARARFEPQTLETDRTHFEMLVSAIVNGKLPS